MGTGPSCSRPSCSTSPAGSAPAAVETGAGAAVPGAGKSRLEQSRPTEFGAALVQEGSLRGASTVSCALCHPRRVDVGEATRPGPARARGCARGARARQRLRRGDAGVGGDPPRQRADAAPDPDHRQRRARPALRGEDHRRRDRSGRPRRGRHSLGDRPRSSRDAGDPRQRDPRAGQRAHGGAAPSSAAAGRCGSTCPGSASTTPRCWWSARPGCRCPPSRMPSCSAPRPRPRRPPWLPREVRVDLRRIEIGRVWAHGAIAAPRMLDADVTRVAGVLHMGPRAHARRRADRDHRAQALAGGDDGTANYHLRSARRCPRPPPERLRPRRR